MRTTHTPGPWETRANDLIYSSSDRFIADCERTLFHNRPAPPNEEDRQNAAHIVRCVNAYDDMLNALKGARRKLEMWPEGSNPEYFPEMKAIDAAIRKAEAAS